MPTTATSRLILPSQGSSSRISTTTSTRTTRTTPALSRTARVIERRNRVLGPLNSRALGGGRRGSSSAERERAAAAAAAAATETATARDEEAPKTPAAPAAIKVNTLNSKFPIIDEAARECGYEVVDDEDLEADVFWFDGPSPPEIYRRLESHQKVNNFPATGEITRKDCLSRNIARLQQGAPEEYNFVPRGWIIPAELSALQKHDAALKKRGKPHSYIVKPVNSAMGRGIFLITSADQLYSNPYFTKADSAIVQEYLHDPLLIDGFKFDLRIYVLVTSCNPLRAFMYKDGLVRLSSSKYNAPTAANADDLFMHLTNYSINKESDEFDGSTGEDKGSKRSIKWLNSWLRREGVDVPLLWSQISDVLIKTLIVGLPHNKHTYNLARSKAGGGGSSSNGRHVYENPDHSTNAGHPAEESCCFQLYGFDVLVEKDLKPYLIEVNRSPSFGATSPLDRSIKLELVKSTLRLLSLDVKKRGHHRERARREAKKRITSSSYNPHHSLGSSGGASDGAVTDDDVVQDSTGGVNEALEHLQVAFEDEVCGEYERIFPPPRSSDRHAAYQTLIDLATREFFGTGKSSAKAAALPPPATKIELDVAALGIADVVARFRSDVKDAGAGAGADAACNSSSDAASAEVGGTSTRANPDDTIAAGWSVWKTGGSTSSGRTGAGRSSSSTATVLRSQRSLSKKGSTKKVKAVTSLAATSAAVKLALLEFDCGEAVDAETFASMKAAPPYSKLRQFYFKTLDWEGRAILFEFVMRSIRTHVFVSSGSKSGRTFDLLTKVFERLLRSKGQGLWNTFEMSGLDWSSLSSILFLQSCTPPEQSCCSKVVDLCRDALMLSYLATVETD